MKVRQEEDIIPVRRSVVVIVVTLLVIAVGTTSAWLLRDCGVEGPVAAERVALPPVPDQIQRMDVMQIEESTLAATLYTRDAVRLGSYGWVAPDAQIIHIPIERAMQLYAAGRAGVSQPQPRTRQPGTREPSTPVPDSAQPGKEQPGMPPAQSIERPGAGQPSGPESSTGQPGKSVPARVSTAAPVRAPVAAKPVSTAIGAPPPLETIAVDEQLGKRIPLDLELTDHAGNAVRLSQYFDGKKPVLMVLAYSSCTMLCSLVLGGLADGLRDLSQPPEDTYRRPPGDTYRVISVSIDPRDRSHEAARMQRVMLDRAAPADSSATWPFLVGTEPAIRALADSLGFRYSWDARTEQYAHPSVVFVLAPDGTIVRYLHGVGFSGLALESALASAAAGHISTSEAEPGGLLRCFRFDAVLRMYGTYIDILFKGGALLIFLGVLAGGVLLWRRERSRRKRGMP